MEIWQVIVMAFLVLLPLALMLDYWPGRERLDARGAPLDRSWRPKPSPPPVNDEHH